MVHTILENIDLFFIQCNHTYLIKSFINPAIKWTILTFPFDISFITFSFDYFFNSKFLLSSLL